MTTVPPPVDSLVGRDRELAMLTAALESPCPATVEVVGDPGIGKTSLLAQLARKAGGAGWTVPDPEALRQLPSADLLDRVSAPHGLVLILDDLHRAEGSEIRLLSQLLDCCSDDAKVVIALGFRPRQIAARALAALARAKQGRRSHRIALGPLCDAEARRFFPADTPPAVCEMLLRSGEGNPFYLEALAGASSVVAGAVTGPRTWLESCELPDASRAVLLAELESLPPRTLLVAKAAAIARQPFSARLIAETMGTGEEPVLNALEELLESDIIRPLEGSLQRFEFRHPLLWHVVRGYGCSVRGGGAARGAEQPPGPAPVVRHLPLTPDGAGHRATELGEVGVLSRRELSVSRLVADGLTNRQIARVLGLSEKTVETHLSRIFRKLGASSRAAVAALMTRANYA